MWKAFPKTQKSIFELKDSVNTMSKMKNKIASENDFAIRLEAEAENEDP